MSINKRYNANKPNSFGSAAGFGKEFAARKPGHPMLKMDKQNKGPMSTRRKSTKNK